MKSRIDDSTMASSSSLANYALRSLIREGSLASRVIDSPRVRHGNLLAKPSIVFVNARQRTFAVLYAVKGRSLQLFRDQSPTARTLRESWRDYARAYVSFAIDADTAVEIRDAGFTARSARELLKPYNPPLTSIEAAALFELLGTRRDSRRAA